MAKRIVQLLVTMAVDADCTRDAVRDEVAEALVIVADEVLVELVGSGQRAAAGTPAAGEGPG